MTLLADYHADCQCVAGMRAREARCHTEGAQYPGEDARMDEEEAERHEQERLSADVVDLRTQTEVKGPP